MKKLNLKSLNLNSLETLNRQQMRTIFGGCAHDEDCGAEDETGGGGGGNGTCTCKLSSTSSAETSTDDCNKCESLCDDNYPSYTSWICSGA